MRLSLAHGFVTNAKRRDQRRRGMAEAALLILEA